MILEEAENLIGERIATVRTSRGEEVSVNVDAAAVAAANLLSDYDNKLLFGWSLSVPWFVERIETLRALTHQPPVSTEGEENG